MSSNIDDAAPIRVARRDFGEVETDVPPELVERDAPLARLRHPPGSRNTSACLQLVGVEDLRCRLQLRRGFGRSHEVLLVHLSRQLERADARQRDEDDVAHAPTLPVSFPELRGRPRRSVLRDEQPSAATNL
jgi:hypothetical protein